MKVEVLRWLQHPYAAKWDDIDELSILLVFSHAIDKRMRARSKGRREERYKGENRFWSSQLNFNLEVQTNTKFRAEANFEILESSGLTLTKYRE